LGISQNSLLFWVSDRDNTENRKFQVRPGNLGKDILLLCGSLGIVWGRKDLRKTL